MVARLLKIFRCKVWMTCMALMVLFGGLAGTSTVAYAAGEVVVVPNASERELTVGTGQSVFIAPNIELNNFGFQIASAKLVIENMPGDASTSYTAVSGLAVSYDSDKMVYSITGTADAADYQTLFRSFKVTSGTTLRQDIKFNFLVSENTTTPMYYSGTGHYYEYISRGVAPIITWTEAAAAASARTYNGMEGYLVTIMSEGENTFTVNKMSGSGWIGISDADADGSWYWSTGPEAGTHFWQGYAPGATSVINGCYNNWYPGEPNRDDATANYGHLFVNSPGWEAYRGYWNDMPDSNTFVQGYVVEYGDMPGDAPEDFDETVTVHIGASVTYSTNGATSGTIPTDSNSPYISGSTVTVLTNSGALAKTGYVFGGWNTQSNGQGTHYDATGTDTFTISSNTTLYAEWLCNVIYDANGATSGTVPTDGNAPYANGATVTVLTNSGTLAKTGMTFRGWNTQADGGGIHYDATGTDSFTISSNVTLYAQWGCDVTYDDNGADGGSVPADSNVPYASGATVTVLTNSGSLVRTGYTFDGWNTQADGVGTHYDATGTDSFTISSDVTLYAQWSCNVIYDANGATGGSVPTDGSAPYASGAMVTVLTNSGSLVRTGYTFDGWNTQADGLGTHYDATGTASFTISSDATLYAQWGCNVTYDANGATSGTVPIDTNAPYAPGVSVAVLTNRGALERTGYVFEGWNTQTDGEGIHYNDDGFDSFTVTSNIMLYAQWAKDTDCDGVCDGDEGRAGTDPNNPHDTPQTGTITVTVRQQDGSAAGGLTCVLNSTPIVITTDADGNVVFSDVHMAPHTLTLRNGSVLLGTYQLDFTRGTVNLTQITDDGATDSDGSVSTMVARNFEGLNVTIQRNGSNFWQLGEVAYTQSTIAYQQVVNPQTGEDRTSLPWILAIVGLLISGGVWGWMVYRKSRVK